MQSAAVFYRRMVRDPANRAWLEAQAQALGIPKPAIARREYARLRREAKAAGVPVKGWFLPPLPERGQTENRSQPKPPCLTPGWCW